MSKLIVLDPAPEEWLTKDRYERFFSAFESSKQLLNDAGVLDDVLKFWIKQELSQNHTYDDPCLGWAKSQWGHRLSSLYLHYKQSMDQASYHLIRVSEQGLALEIYHRLLAKEDTFELLSIKYGVGSERYNGGLVNLQTLGSVPAGFANYLRKIEPGEVTKPLRLGDLFAVVRLNELIPAVQTEEINDKLLSQELQRWIDGIATHLKGQLNFLNA